MNDMITSPEREAKVSSTGEGMAILDRVKKAVANARYEKIEIGFIRPMKGQPRKYFNSDRMDELVESIQSVGQAMPGFVRPIKRDAEGHRFELIDGERRYIAIQRASIPTYRAMIVEIDDEAAQYIVSMIANFNRQGHTVLEIADSIRTSHEKLKLPMPNIAGLIGYHKIYVTNLYGLRRLVPEVRIMLDPEHTSKVLPTSAAILISREVAELQLTIAEAVVSKQVSLGFLPDYIAQLKATSLSDDNDNEGEVVGTSTRNQPNVVRRDIRRKITNVARNISVVKMLLEKTPISVLRGMERHELTTVRKQLEEARDSITTSLGVIQKL